MFNIKQRVQTAVLVSLFSSASAWGAGYGLFVGIDHYDPYYISNPLNSCVNDANGFKEELASDAQRWPAANLSVLTDRAATKSAIRGRLAALAGTAVPGDVVVFFQSSHGGQDLGAVTCLCAYDDDYWDGELAQDLLAFRSGVSVVIVVDACHSAGLFKEASRAGGEWNFAQNVMDKMAAFRAKSKALEKGASVGWITACNYDESSMTGEPYSLFVGYFLRGFLYADTNSDGVVSFLELYNFASPFALADNPGQHAQVLNTGLLNSIAAKAIGTNLTVSLKTALDSATLSWETDGSRVWYGQTVESSDGEDAAHTGIIGNEASSWLQTTVEGPGVLRFNWKASSERFCDYLGFYFDGEQQGEGLSGETEWLSEEFKIAEGMHTLRWSYTKDYSVASGSDCGWVDQVVWTPYAKVVLDAWVGVSFSVLLPESFSSAAKVTVIGLPPGLKYNAVTRMIAGVPTQQGTYAVAFSAADIASQTVTITVEALPAWAQGSFNGSAGGGGLASMSVTAAGKVSGKVTAGGTNYTFAAASYTRYDADTETYWIETQAKAGKAVKALEIGVLQPGGIDQWLGYAVPENVAAAESGNAWLLNGREGGVPLLMWRDVWKEAPETLALFSGYYTATLPCDGESGSGYLTLTVDKAGKVKAAGKLGDGTAVSLSGALLIDGSGFVSAALYAAPAAYKGGMFFGVAEFVKPFDGEAFSGEVYLACWEPGRWENRNPQATGTYGAGFARETGLVGGWYSKTGNLYDYYRNKNLIAVTDAPAPELTVGTARYESVWWNPSGVALTPVLKSGAMTGLAAPAPGKPVDPDKDGKWDYSAANSVGLKIALARPTGVFKGSFLAWFDYPEKKHVSKSLAFEGVLTPEREDPADGIEGRGFFLWPDKALIPATAKTYSFKGSYDFLIVPTE